MNSQHSLRIAWNIYFLKDNWEITADKNYLLYDIEEKLKDLTKKLHICQKHLRESIQEWAK